MDPLSALAIVAAVVQFADVGHRLLKSWLQPQREPEQQGPSVKELRTELGFLTEAIHALSKDPDLQAGRMMPGMVEIVLERCATLMKRLGELEDAQPPKGPSPSGRFDKKSYGKPSNRRDALEDVKVGLDELKTCVISVLGASIWYAPAPILLSHPASLTNTQAGSIQRTARDGSFTSPTN